ncbi:AAA family ATPase [Dactylosporangium sucinum]|uniref:AAA+ ATPase domain-containing protein n=1 Tax=Dactylosporangium sucinum TaxID=1424081 RepID=A0A917TVY6_9ACTN|nr:ATP-binding protein [Dactylosporangium sucinum]GGM40492.1 hypothetical protein GCM10007977_047390 [Dactylosporangium sucinum]
MTSSPPEEPRELAVVGVAMGKYQHADKYPLLANTVPLLRAVAECLSAQSRVIADAPMQELRDELDQALPGGGLHGRSLILVWSGHGASVHGDLRLITRDTARSNQNGTYPPSALAELAVESGAEQILLIIDTCHAGAGVVPVLTTVRKATDAAMQTPVVWIGVLAASMSYTKAREGALLGHLRAMLASGPSTPALAPVWNPHTRFLRGDELLFGLVQEWKGDARHKLDQATQGHPGLLLPNPRYQPGGEVLVAHLLAASRGADPGEQAWYFSGRKDVLRPLVERIREPEPGIVVVTGPGGCGKSAVLGRLAALSDAGERANVLRYAPLGADDPDPGPHSVSANLNLRNKTPDDLVAELGAQLGEPDARTIWALMDLASRRPRPPVIIVDGLDEAGTEARRLATAIGRLSEVCCVLVATRPFEAGAALAGQVESLPQALAAPSTTVVDLGDVDAATVRADVEEYVHRRLAGLHHRRAVAPIADLAMADEQGGSFLLARVLTAHVDDAAGDARLPASIEEAFDLDLGRWPELRRDGRPVPGAARDLMYALAFAAGNGFPARDVWPAAATALRNDGFEFRESDIYTLLGELGENYGRYVISSSEDEQAVYRLYHRRLVDHLRGTVEIEDKRAGRVFEALRSLAERQLRDAA